MKEKLLNFFKSKKGGTILFIAGMVTIACIFASSFFTSGNQDSSGNKPAEFSEEEYLKTLEQEVSEIVLGISGDPSAVVTVTLETGIVYEYADETKKGSAADKEKTSEESEKTYITVKDKAGGEVPLIITSRMPQVRGVAIICNAADEETAQKISDAVSAALDVSSRKIYVGRKLQ